MARASLTVAVATLAVVILLCLGGVLVMAWEHARAEVVAEAEAAVGSS